MGLPEGTLPAGTTLGYADIPPSAYSDLAKLKNITPPNQKVASVKASNSDSAGQIHEYIPGWTEPGTVTFTAQYKDTRHAEVLGLKGVQKTWKITYPDAATEVFEGFITEVQVVPGDLAGDLVMTSNVTMQVNGESVYTPD